MDNDVKGLSIFNFFKISKNLLDSLRKHSLYFANLFFSMFQI